MTFCRWPVSYLTSYIYLEIVTFLEIMTYCLLTEGVTISRFYCTKVRAKTIYEQHESLHGTKISTGFEIAMLFKRSNFKTSWSFGSVESFLYATHGFPELRTQFYRQHKCLNFLVRFPIFSLFWLGYGALCKREQLR